MILQLKYKQCGYSALELIGVLAICCFIVLITDKFITAQREVREVNQLADQSKNYSHIAIKYLEDNYRNLVQQTSDYAEAIIPFSIFSGYAPNEITAITKRYQTPCLYVTKGTNSSLIAYLIFGNTNSRAHSLEQLTVAKVAQTFGENAGTLINQNGSYILNGGVENDFNFSSSSINNIIGGCGFRAPFPKYSLVVDLTKNIELFASIKGNLDQQSTAKEPDPSLKKDGDISGDKVLATMETNLYLDNIVKESTYKTTYYCDATKLPSGDANAVCTNYALEHKISMYAGTASWISSMLDATGAKCIATASAHFYSTSTIYACNGVTFPDANSFCPASKSGQNKVSGSAYWSPNPGTLSGTQCISTAYATYQTPGNCNYSCLSHTTKGMYTEQPCSLFNGDCNGRGYAINITSVYDAKTNMCIMTAQCSKGGGTGSKSEPPLSSGSTSVQSCGQKSMSAKSSQATNDMGFKNC